MKRIHWRYWVGLAGAAAWAVVALPTGAQNMGITPSGGTAPGPSAEAAPTPAVPTSEMYGRISLEMENVPAEDALRRLGAVLASEVQIEGTSTRRVTLKLENLPVRDALERASAAIGATWKRVYVFSKDTGLAAPAPVPTGLTVNLNLTDTSCQAAATIAAKAAGARMEADGELTGRVTVAGKDLPVEETMDRIAKAAGATWRIRYVFKLDATLPASSPADTKPETTQPNPPEKNIPSYERDRYRVGPNGKRVFPRMPKERRTRYNTLGKYGAKAKPKPAPDVAKLEQISRLGNFAGIFSEENDTKRGEQIQLFLLALQTQSQRLDNFDPAQRRMATRLSRNQFQTILDDVRQLSEEQKKEIAPIIDFLKKRIGELDKVLETTK
jgi:hypothetical protein